jgi:hypothetical protein
MRSTPFGSTRNDRASRGIAFVACVLSVLFLLSGVRPLHAQNDGPPDADMKAVQSYRLTESGLSKFMQATRNIAQVAKAHPEIAKQEENNNAKSLADMEAVYNRHPEIKHAISSAGMSSHDYILFSLAVFQAGMAAGVQQMSGKLPDGVSAENVDFYKKHEAEMKKFGDEMQQMDSTVADTSSGA